MRQELENLHRRRYTFTGVFSGYGSKIGINGGTAITLLLADIKLGRREVIAQSFIEDRAVIRTLKGLRVGDLIKFEAMVSSFKRGYVNKIEGVDDRETFYKLSRFDNARIA